MRFGTSSTIKTVVLIAIMSLGFSVRGLAIEKSAVEPRSLLQHGFAADSHLLLAAQQVRLLGESTYQSNLRAGWHIFNLPYVNLLAGYAGSTLGNLNSQASDYKRYQLSYSGPVFELLIFPEYSAYLGIYGYMGKGAFRAKKEKQDPTSKGRIQVTEIGGEVFYRLQPYIHVGIQVASFSSKYRKLENYLGEETDSTLSYALAVRFTTF